MCTVCAFGIAAGLGISRFLGVSDFITGIWSGAILLSLSILLWNWLKKKNWWIFSKSVIPTLAVFWIFTFLPLWLSHIISSQSQKVLGINSLFLGAVLGTIILELGLILENQIRRKNNTKALFPFQKVIIPILCLLIASVVLYFIRL